MYVTEDEALELAVGTLHEFNLVHWACVVFCSAVMRHELILIFSGMNINYIEPVVPVAGADQTEWIMALILAGH